MEYLTEFNDILNKLNVSTIIDNIDDILLPRHGYSATINYEGSFREFGSESPYTRIDISTKIYQTFLKKQIEIDYDKKWKPPGFDKKKIDYIAYQFSYIYGDQKIYQRSVYLKYENIFYIVSLSAKNKKDVLDIRNDFFWNSICID